MRATLDVLYAVAGQAIYFDAPEGRPSSVTSVDVYPWNYSDDDDPELALDGAPELEAAPNTTTNAAAGVAQADPRRVPLTSTAGCVTDRTYLLVGADGVREIVLVAELEAGAAIAHYPLHGDFASGAAFVSTRIVATLDDDWVADDTNIDATAGAWPMYRARWVYVVDGVTHVADTYFNLVRYGARHAVTPQDVDNFRPGWLTSLPVDHKADQGRRLIAEAAREVQVDLLQLELDDAAIADATVLDSLVRYKTVELTEFARFLNTPNADEARSIAAGKRYAERLDALVRVTSKVPMRDVDAVAAKVPATPLSRR